MPGFDLFRRDDPSGEAPFPDDHCGRIERLHSQPTAEAGPLPPETVAMIAVAVAALPLLSLCLPAIPMHPLGWRMAPSLMLVWLAAYWIQGLRYRRFHEHLDRRMAEGNGTAGPGERSLAYED